MPFATTSDGAQIHYRDYFFGPPWAKPRAVLLLHGIRSNQATWNEWIPTLASHYRVITYDARGRGRSDTPPPGFAFSMARFAADAADVLTAAGIQRAHVVGASFGGVTGLQFAVSHPDRLHSLTLVTAPYRFTQLEAVVSGWIAAIQRDGLAAFTRADLVNLLGADATPAAVEWQTRQFGELGADYTIRLFTFMKTVNLDHLLPSIVAPTLVLAASASDRAPTSEIDHLMSRLPNARLETLVGYHHNLATLAPQRCADLTLDFVRQVDQSSR